MERFVMVEGGEPGKIHPTPSLLSLCDLADRQYSMHTAAWPIYHGTVPPINMGHIYGGQY